MKKTIKILLIVIIIFLLVNIFSKVFAAINPDDYEPNAVTQEEVTTMFTKVKYVLGSIRNISVVVSVISLMIIGVKYIFGSVEEKANYKATMFPYIIGCVMVAGGTTLVSFIYNMIH